MPESPASAAASQKSSPVKRRRSDKVKVILKGKGVFVQEVTAQLLSALRDRVEATHNYFFAVSSGPDGRTRTSKVPMVGRCDPVSFSRRLLALDLRRDPSQVQLIYGGRVLMDVGADGKVTTLFTCASPPRGARSWGYRRQPGDRRPLPPLPPSPPRADGVQFHARVQVTLLPEADADRWLRVKEIQTAASIGDLCGEALNALGPEAASRERAAAAAAAAGRRALVVTEIRQGGTGEFLCEGRSEADPYNVRRCDEAVRLCVAVISSPALPPQRRANRPGRRVPLGARVRLE